ncbi:MAG: ABZJ_00895 family protein [Alcanivoracaceae bacterium]|nr:ABZJ_00895 family protein [Alcanivoracaceae bacterium]
MDDAYKTPAAALDADGSLQYPLSRYLWRFSMFYVAFSAADILLAAFGLDTPGVVGLLITAFSAWFAGRLFLADNSRLPTADERRALVRRSLVILLMLSVAIYAVVLAAMGEEARVQMLQPVSEMPMWVWALIILFGVVITWAALAWGYGSMLEKTFKKQRG